VEPAGIGWIHDGIVANEGQKGDNPLASRLNLSPEKNAGGSRRNFQSDCGSSEVVTRVIALLREATCSWKARPGLGKTMLVRTLARLSR